MDKTLVVIGAGASSVSFIDSFLDSIQRLDSRPGITIYVLDKSPHFGRGTAYSRDHSTNLLNTRAGFISPFSNKPGHFYKWLVANKDSWEDDYPQISLDMAAFVPRPLFGYYLECMMAELVKRAVKLGIRLFLIQAEATSVGFGQDGRVIVGTDTSVAFQCDHVLLSCGNLGTSEFNHLRGASGFFSSPYPVKRLTRRIHPEQSVGILGSRLSAIDAVIALSEAGHKADLTLYSRSGFLPSVRGIQGRYEPSIISREAVERHIQDTGSFRLHTLIDWLQQEMRAAGETYNWSQWKDLLRPEQPVAFLEREIQESETPRTWQAVLYATNSVIDRIWAAMPDEDRSTFWPYLSAWMAYRVSIPTENAQRLLSLMKSGQLRLATDFMGVIKDEDGLGIRLAAQPTPRRHDVIIAATGTPRDAAKLDSQLIQHMLSRGIAVAHPYGGICVDSETGYLSDASGFYDNRISVLGELTSGTFFFTSVLEINARHARKRAMDLVAYVVAAIPAAHVAVGNARMTA